MKNKTKKKNIINNNIDEMKNQLFALWQKY